MGRRRRKKRNRLIWKVAVLLVVVIGTADVYFTRRQVGIGETASSTPTPVPIVVATSSPTTVPTPTPLPAQAMVSVPFQVQAPYANWDALHEDACEETSLIMVKHFLDSSAIGSSDQADKEIKDMVAYETSRGYGPSITMTELRKVADQYYNLTTGRVEHDATIEDLKRELARGNPVIIPAAGKLLPNPHFSNGGPNYHMLVLTGYDAGGFITNDPGIREGHGFRYTFEALYKALHDWDPADITKGGKTYLVFDR